MFPLGRRPAAKLGADQAAEDSLGQGIGELVCRDLGVLGDGQGKLAEGKPLAAAVPSLIETWTISSLALPTGVAGHSGCFGTVGVPSWQTGQRRACRSSLVGPQPGRLPWGRRR